MKAEAFKIEESLDFRLAEGLILVKGNRLLAFNSDAMGTLRKDLISNLSFDRAKGFLVRYGWNCGYNDALKIKEQLKVEGIKDWINGGITLQHLEGPTGINIEIKKINYSEKSWLVRGQFINSFEAKQHLNYFGVADSPVCWLLVSYASGCSSAFFGEPVFYQEVKCVGKGDSVCEFVGKTLPEWGNEILAELPYYEETKISEELAEAHRRIQEQHRQLKRAFDIHQQLTDLVLKGESLPGITQTLSRITNGTVFVFDTKLDFLAICSHGGQNFLETLQKKVWEHLEYIISRKRLDHYNTLINNKKALLLKFRVCDKLWTCIIAPIMAGDDSLGFVAVVQIDNKEIKQDLRMAVEGAANVYALEILKQKAIIDSQQLLRGDFFDNLLSANIPNPKALVNWGLRLSHNIILSHNVIVLDIKCIDLNKYNSEDKSLLLRKEILNITDTYIKNSYTSALCGIVKDHIIILLPSEKVSNVAIRKTCKSLKQKIEHYFPNLVTSFGVGTVTKEIHDYHKSYSQALKALRILKIFQKNGHCIFFDDLGSVALLLESNNKQELESFMLSKLGPLIEYDQKYKTNLIESLQQYLNIDSIRKASKKTSLSVSGLKYRLNKIKEFGYNLQSPQEKFDLQLALKILSIISAH